MDIYLPIAETSQNLFFLLTIGFLAGILSGMFGVGGGFLTTPILIISGIPPAVAVGSEANHIVGSSLTGFLNYFRRKYVDITMGSIMISGGAFGSIIGVYLFRYLSSIGRLEEVIAIAYIFFLGILGLYMLFESIKTKKNKALGNLIKLHDHAWFHGLPFRLKFRRSKLYISVIPPFLISFLIGIIASILGVGGGFILVPAMIYILGMSTQVVIGTSLMQVLFVSIVSTIMHAYVNQTVDVILAGFLLFGGVFGVQAGAVIVQKVSGEIIRLLLGILIFSLCVFLLSKLLIDPSLLFILEFLR
ncbi:MAG: sulfite exporter TauE/SafE family protein [Pseudomonadota bacterium]|nr:sulfite exporter TauE/SafE family protein [Pseudomonadota bacterium]